MNFNKKIAAFDLDGTLAESKMTLTPEMAKLLRSLALVSKVTVISGAGFSQFKIQFLSTWEDCDASEIERVNQNLILLPANGSRQYEYDVNLKKWVVTFEELFNPEVKVKVVKALQEIIDSGLYDFASLEERVGELIEDRDTQISLSALGQQAPIERKKVWDPDQKKRQKIKLDFDERLKGFNVISTIGGTTTIDILPGDFNKAKGLQRLLKKLNLDMADMIFVGDSIFPGGNDYSPFEAGIESVKVSGPEETFSVIKNWLD